MVAHRTVNVSFVKSALIPSHPSTRSTSVGTTAATSLNTTIAVIDLLTFWPRWSHCSSPLGLELLQLEEWCGSYLVEDCRFVAPSLQALRSRGPCNESSVDRACI
ncbi:hypothetical protein PM082_003755 [Marasmius tenuissimus]|nr:hypothetical protein PM082_003755 [Marasmius tenuissimus]